MTQVEPMEFNESEAQEQERTRPKIGRIPANLRLLNATDASAAEGQDDISLTARKDDTRFMFLLVGLFIIVNLLLVTLVNNKEKPAAAPAQQATQSAPAAAPIVSIAIQPASKPSAPVAAEGLAKPAAASKATGTLTLPAAPPTPPLPVATPAYVTPASPNSVKAVAAPVQQVTVSDTHQGAPEQAQDNLVITHTPAPHDAALPAIAPAAGETPAAAPSPANATQDLLSVINKD